MSPPRVISWATVWIVEAEELGSGGVREGLGADVEADLAEMTTGWC